MAQVQEYLPQVQAQDPVGGTSPNIELSGAVGRSIERVGGAISEGTQIIHRRMAQEEQADVYADFAEKRSNYIAQLHQQTQDGSLDVDKFAEQYDQETAAAGENIGTSEGKNTFARQQARTRASLLQIAMSGKAQIASNVAKGRWSKLISDNSNSIEMHPDQFHDLHSQGLEAVDDQIKNGGLPEKMRDKAVQEMSAEYSKAAIRGWANLSPEAARQMMKGGAYDQYLSSDQKYQMAAEVNHIEAGKEAEKNRTRRAVDDAHADAYEAWGKQALQQLENNALSDTNVLAKVKDGTLDWKEGAEWINRINQHAKKELKTDPRIKNALIQRIVDPNSTDPITSIQQAMPSIGHGISITDMNQLSGLIDKTKDGAALKSGQADLHRVINTVKFKNLMSGGDDILGVNQANTAWVDYIQARDSAKTMQEKLDLLNPHSPTYFGSEENLRKYQTSPRKQGQHQHQQRVNKALKLPTDKDPNPSEPPAESAKKPNESIMQNLMRNGDFK